MPLLALSLGPASLIPVLHNGTVVVNCHSGRYCSYALAICPLLFLQPLTNVRQSAGGCVGAVPGVSSAASFLLNKDFRVIAGGIFISWSLP